MNFSRVCHYFHHPFWRKKTLFLETPISWVGWLKTLVDVFFFSNGGRFSGEHRPSFSRGLVDLNFQGIGKDVPRDQRTPIWEIPIQALYSGYLWVSYPQESLQNTISTMGTRTWTGYTRPCPLKFCNDETWAARWNVSTLIVLYCPTLIIFMTCFSFVQYDATWKTNNNIVCAIYNDLSRGHPKWWFSPKWP